MRYLKTIIITVISIIILGYLANRFLFRESSHNNVQMVQESVELKEKFLYLKLTMMDKDGFAALPNYHDALKAERIGNAKFENGDYLAAKHSYMQALDYIKLAIAIYNDNKPINPEETFAENQHERITNQKIMTEPDLSFVSNNQQPESTEYTPHQENIDTTFQTAIDSQDVTSTTPSFLKEESEVSDLIATEKKNPISFTIKEKDISYRENHITNYNHILNQSRKAPDFALNKEKAKTDIEEKLNSQDVDISKSYQDTLPDVDIVQHKILATKQLITDYEISLASKNLNILKALFQENFTEEDEKAWLNFFNKVIDLRADVIHKNEDTEILGNEVNLSITLNYSNHKGVKQIPLLYTEGWTLAPLNGEWAVTKRRFDSQQLNEAVLYDDK